VLEAGATARTVRLPRGEWVEAWSGARVLGARVVEAPAGRDVAFRTVAADGP
jgi:alpha-glucosidase (family GH31 glycosyl hydrolase)